MSINQPFFPTYGQSVTLNSTNASASATIKPGNKQLRVVNTGPNNVHICVLAGGASRAATAADFIVPFTTNYVGVAIISIPEDATTVTHIAPAGTATVYIQPGEGY